ncbi:MAG: hypothetical protein V4726_19365 [Verrucomicrobiota bacterium]
MPAYNIDELKAGSGHPAELLFRLWGIWREAGPDVSLLPEERIVHDAWTYDTANGNGIGDILINERYDEFASGLGALRHLGSPELDLYVAGIVATLNKFGIDAFNPESIDAAFLRGESPLSALEAAEQPFLKQLWNGAILEAAQTYINQHIEAFRHRGQAD